jgi:hypothetical protein
MVSMNQINGNDRGIFCSYAPKNLISKNNFISNIESAKFTKYAYPGFLKPNTWMNNYWDDWVGFGIKIIPGLMYIPRDDQTIGWFVPWIEADFSPVYDPYDFSGGGTCLETMVCYA